MQASVGYEFQRDQIKVQWLRAPSPMIAAPLALPPSSLCFSLPNNELPVCALKPVCWWQSPRRSSALRWPLKAVSSLPLLTGLVTGDVLGPCLSSGCYPVHRPTQLLLSSVAHKHSRSQVNRVQRSHQRNAVILLPSCLAKMPCLNNSQGPWKKNKQQARNE